MANDIAQGTKLKGHALTEAIDFLEEGLDQLLEPLHDEVKAAERWRRTVDDASNDFYERYKREYIDGEHYGEFNKAILELMALLEIPYIGQVISMIAKTIKNASRYAFKWIGEGVRLLLKMEKRQPEKPPELRIITDALNTYLETLKGIVDGLKDDIQTKHDGRQARARDRRRLAWDEIGRTLDNAGFRDHYFETWSASYDQYQKRVEKLTQETALKLYQKIAEDPSRLKKMRGIRLATDVVATVLVVIQGGLTWTDMVMGPLVAPVLQLILEAGLGRYVEYQKSQLRKQQLNVFKEVVGGSLVNPIYDLFQPSVGPDQLEQARRDVGLLRSASLAVVNAVEG